MVKKPVRGKSILVGASGEHFVMAELLYRGVVAGLSPRNSTPYDILATDLKRSTNIWVKIIYKSPQSEGWQFSRDDEGNVYREVGPNDFTVLVALKTL